MFYTTKRGFLEAVVLFAFSCPIQINWLPHVKPDFYLYILFYEVWECIPFFVALTTLSSIYCSLQTCSIFRYILHVLKTVCLNSAENNLKTSISLNESFHCKDTSKHLDRNSINPHQEKAQSNSVWPFSLRSPSLKHHSKHWLMLHDADWKISWIIC